MSLSPFRRRLASKKRIPRGRRRQAWPRPIPEALEDRTLLALLLVDTNNDGNARDTVLTLREAILVSNGDLKVAQLGDDEKAHVIGDPLDAALNLISFNINGGGAQTIGVKSEPLPKITHSVLINGATQPNYDGKPLITLAGQDAGQAVGLEITAGGSTVQGLRISGFKVDGIRVSQGGGNTFVGNVLGTDDLLHPALGNLVGINIIDSADNTIGGLNTGERNVISGNRADGVSILNGGSTKNVVLGNAIGTDLEGTKAVGNGRFGVILSAAEQPVSDTYASENIVRNNLISGNGGDGNGDGVFIFRGTHNTISANIIGLDGAGAAPMPNGRDGVRILEGSDNLIGVTPEFSGNFISANKGSGIDIRVQARSATGNLIRGNFIGTDFHGETGVVKDGDHAGEKLGNVFSGIAISNMSQDPAVSVLTTSIGGGDAEDSQDLETEDGVAQFKNVISGNLQNGIFMTGPRILNTFIRGNYIGTNNEGDKPVPNLGGGIVLQARATGEVDPSGKPVFAGPSSTFIGGPEALAGNLISGNESNGIFLGGFSTHTSVVQNTIGLTADGLHRLSNEADGIAIRSSGNTIGGTTKAERNVISASRLSNGIRIQPEPVATDGPPVPDPATGNVVSGNYIGTDVNGKANGPDNKPNTGDEPGNAFNGVLIVSASDNVIGGFSDDAGNVIGGNGFDGVAIYDDSTNNRVIKNRIGVGPDNAAIPNRIGVFISRLGDGNAPSGNFIGDTGPLGLSFGNLIGFNREDGIQLSSSAHANQIISNFIGTNEDGTADLGNTQNGVSILDSSNNTIGGRSAARGNVIVFNKKNGVLIGGIGNSTFVIGNSIGVVSGATASNGANGVFIDGSDNNFIGDGAAGSRNLISGNFGAGVLISGGGATENQVLGNYIGTTENGSAPASNAGDGVLIQGGAALNQIGGQGDLARNVISGNGIDGVAMFLAGSGNIVRNNYIGLNAAGTDALKNNANGVRVLDTPGTIIGGNEAASGNVISGHVSAGIGLGGALTVGTRIQNNYIGTDKNAAEALGNLNGILITVAASIGGGAASKTQVDHNVVAGNLQVGIFLSQGTTGNLVEDNRIGTGPEGIDPESKFGAQLPNLGWGVLINNSPGNRFDRNLIGFTKRQSDSEPDGTSGHGVEITGAASKGNSLESNFIRENAGEGVRISAGASENRIGSTDLPEGNVIYGNRNGVLITGNGTSKNVLIGNDIGVTEKLEPAGNLKSGVAIVDGASNNFVGFVLPNLVLLGGAAAPNLISANKSFGVLIDQANGNTVVGNYIGTDRTDDLAKQYSNKAGVAISDASGNTIGGETDSIGNGPGNRISGNGVGVQITGAASKQNAVQGNEISGGIGFDEGGGGGGVVVAFGPSNNRIGGPKSTQGNSIHGNKGAGVFVDSGVGNSILHNRIFHNEGLDIDLAPEGPTDNDALPAKDGDVGANNLQNFPKMAFATMGKSHRVVGTLESAASKRYTIEIFAESELGEGAEKFVTSALVDTNGSGIGFFDIALPADTEITGANPTRLLATATDQDGNTSELSDLSVNILNDYDGDGLSDVIEDQGPTADGNADGKADHDQPEVAMLADAIDGNSFVTLVATGGKTLSNVRALQNPSPDDAPVSTQFSLGFFDFSVKGLAVVPGHPEHVVVKMILPVTVGVPTTYWRYGKTPSTPIPHWYNWNYDRTTDTGAEIFGNTVVLHFVDGARGDDDLKFDGKIEDAGGPGFHDPFTVTNTLDSGPGSLRQAILNANDSPGLDTISFDIPGSGPFTIQPLSALPAISDATIVDGTTQQGFNGTPVIELDGSLAGAGVDGLIVDGGSSAVRGLAINRFSGDGIRIEFGGGDQVEGNDIGTDITGTVALGNGGFGVEISDSFGHTIGGSQVASRNVISGNAAGGVFIHGDSGLLNSVIGNLIGTGVDGTSALGNQGPGIALDGNASLINVGDGTPSGSNTIAFNAGAGIVIKNSLANPIQRNSIFANGGLGIDLGGEGVTPNDAGDGDSGPNDLQNFPDLTSVTSIGGITRVTGTFNGKPNSDFNLEFYVSDGADSSGFGQGQTFLGSSLVHTTAAGQATFDQSFAHTAAAGAFVAATATYQNQRDQNFPTSEFSQAIAVPPIPATLVFTVDTTEDVNRGAVDPAHMSLREAIQAANAHPGLDSIAFNIPGLNRTISPLSALPEITDPVVIDATTQPGYKGLPLVELEGSKAGVGVNGLTITGGGTVVRGLAINRFRFGFNADHRTGVGILVRGFGGSRIEGNFLDTDITGTNLLPNETAGVFIENSSDNVIGGTTPEARNLTRSLWISGFDTDTNTVLDHAHNNRVLGNYVGTDVTGTVSLLPPVPGIAGGVVLDGASSNIIGGDTSGAGNLIIGTVLVSLSNNNVVQGNLLGTDFTGTKYLGCALVVQGNGNLIGGTTPGARNVVAGGPSVVGGPFGIRVEGSRNLIQGNYVGTDITGSVALARNSLTRGISLGSGAFNTIGGTSPGAGNLISGNSVGIELGGLTFQTLVQGNRIGTDVTGTKVLGNGTGIGGSSFSGLNFIGGLAPGAGNLISGNGVGVAAGSGVRVQGNLIGTDVTGTVALGNMTGITSDGDVFHQGPASNGVVIGGPEPGAANVISGNTLDGIRLGGSLSILQGNFIGTDATGTLRLSNGGAGIHIVTSQDNLIGGVMAGEGNVISANGGAGIFFDDNANDFFDGNSSTGNVVQGNKIGTDATGTADLGNAGDGVRILASSHLVGNNLIGGPDPGAGLPDAGNVIAFNGGHGIYALFSTGNAFRGNAVFGNAESAIAVGINDALSSYAEERSSSLSDGVPVLTSAVFDSKGTVLFGTLKGSPLTRYDLDFFANEAFPPSGFGEAQEVLESTTVFTDASGLAAFRHRLEFAVPTGEWITATATDPAGNTSPLSRTIPVVLAAPALDSVQFSAPAYVVTEHGVAATIVVTRIGLAAGTVTVDYATSDGTAVGGADYAEVSGTLTFNDGETSEEVTVPIQDDSLTEGHEEFGIHLLNPSGVSLGSASEGVVTIADDDLAGKVEFSSSASTASEDLDFKAFAIPITRTGGSRGRVTVEYRVTGGTATPWVTHDTVNPDYSDLFGTVTFEDGQTTAEIFVGIVNDDGTPVFEGPETIELTLGNPTGGATLGAVTTTVVTIRDDEDLHGALAFAIGAHVREEAGFASVQITRRFVTDTTVSVDYATRDDTALAGLDYQAVSGTLTFLPGETSKTILVPIIDNGILQDTRTLQVVLSNPTDGALIIPGRDSTNVVIDDNDLVADVLVIPLSATHSDISVFENAGFATFRVTRLGDAKGVVTVDYATTDGTALAGSDYTATSGTLTFQDGERFKDISIPILRDSVIDGGERFFVTLSNPTGGATIDERNSTGITIREGTGTFEFTATEDRVAENNAGFTVTITLAGAAIPGPTSGTEVFTVDYLIHGGTASAGADFQAISGTLTFSLASVRQTITVPIINDLQAEVDETIFVTLSNATGGAAIGEQGEATLTILDEDQGAPGDLASAGGPYSVLEGEALHLSAVIESGTPTDFSWDVNGDGVFGDAVGQNPTLTWAQLNALGIVNGPSTFDVRVLANDSQGQPITSAATPLTVENANPTAVLSDGGAVSEGTPTNVVFSGAFDPSPADLAAGLLYSYDFNNDGEFTDEGEAADITDASRAFTFADDGTHTVRGRVKDEDGGYNDYFIEVRVENVAPVIALVGSDAVGEGSAYVLSLDNVVDPGQDTVTSYAIHWGDGTTETFTGSPNGVSRTHTYGDGALGGTVQTIIIDLTDEDGTFAAAGSKIVTVNNLAPVAVDDLAATNEDAAVTINVLANDSDPAGAFDPLQIASVTNGSSGTARIDTRGTADTADDAVVYTPNPGATGDDSFTYTISDGDGGTATATVRVQIRNLVDLTGRVFDDRSNDGLYQPADGDVGLGGVTVQLFDEASGVLVATRTTTADGTYAFDVNLTAGTYRLVGGQTPGFLDGRETAGNLGGLVDNTRDSNQITGIRVGEPGTTTDAVDYLLARIRPSRILGLVWSDLDDDGQVDTGEQGISGVVVQLTGVDDRGSAVSRSVTTATDGTYAFADLRPSNAAGYTIQEVQPTGFLDGKDSLGQVNGKSVGNASVNDTFSGLVLLRPDSLAEKYNFGERPSSSGGVLHGQTATIGFWQNKNGQSLIKSLNGGGKSTRLGDWLAATLPNLYGAPAGANNLAGKTNEQVAAFYKVLFSRTSCSGAGGGPPKVDAQVLAAALAVYVTNSALAGTTATAYGFLVTDGGVGARTFDVGADGAAFGVADHTRLTVIELLRAVNRRARKGLLYDLNGDGDATDCLETRYRTMANDLFTNLNETGDIR